MSALNTTFHGVENTICLNMKKAAAVKGYIPIGDVLDLIQQDGKRKLRSIQSIIQHTVTGHTMVRFDNDEEYKEVLERFEKGVLWVKTGKTVHGWPAGSKLTRLTLYNVIPETDKEIVIKELEKHGKIVSKEMILYPEDLTIRTGVVEVKIKLNKGAIVPRYIVDVKTGNTVEVVDRDNKGKVCYRCLEQGHLKAQCTKERVTKEEASLMNTWAKIVSPKKTPLEIADETIDIVTEIFKHNPPPYEYDKSTFKERTDGKWTGTTNIQSVIHQSQAQEGTEDESGEESEISKVADEIIKEIQDMEQEENDETKKGKFWTDQISEDETEEKQVEAEKEKEEERPKSAMRNLFRKSNKTRKTNEKKGKRKKWSDSPTEKEEVLNKLEDKKLRMMAKDRKPTPHKLITDKKKEEEEEAKNKE